MKIKVLIKEEVVKSKIVEIEAENEDDALEMAQDLYYEGEIEMDNSDVDEINYSEFEIYTEA